MREPRSEPRQHQRDDETRYRDAGKGDRDEVREHADRRHGAERERADRRGNERGGECGRGEPREARCPGERAARPDHRAHTRDRQPRTHGLECPRVLEQDTQSRERHDAARRDHALAQARHLRQGQHRSRSHCGRRETEQPEITEQQDGRRAEPCTGREGQLAEDEREPGGDKPDVQPGNGQEVREARAHVALSDVGIESRVGSEHERVHDRRTGAEELSAPRGECIAQRAPPARHEIERAHPSHHQQAHATAPVKAAPLPCDHPRRPAPGAGAFRPAQSDRAVACPGEHVRVHDPAAHGSRVFQADDRCPTAPWSPLPAPCPRARGVPLPDRRRAPEHPRDPHDPDRRAERRARREPGGGRQQRQRHPPQRHAREREGVEPRPQADPECCGEDENRRPHLRAA